MRFVGIASLDLLIINIVVGPYALLHTVFLFLDVVSFGVKQNARRVETIVRYPYLLVNLVVVRKIYFSCVLD